MINRFQNQSVNAERRFWVSIRSLTLSLRSMARRKSTMAQGNPRDKRGKDKFAKLSRKYTSFHLSYKMQLIYGFRTHRQRLQDYMTALEDEILRLRGIERQLNQISNDWRRCSLALIGSSRDKTLPNHWIRHLSPGDFLWLVMNESSPEHHPSFYLTSGVAPHFEWTSIPPALELFDSLTRELLFNCMLLPPIQCISLTWFHTSPSEYRADSGYYWVSWQWICQIHPPSLFRE